jgi:hypothetical protein
METMLLKNQTAARKAPNRYLLNRKDEKNRPIFFAANGLEKDEDKESAPILIDEAVGF